MTVKRKNGISAADSSQSLPGQLVLLAHISASHVHENNELVFLFKSVLSVLNGLFPLSSNSAYSLFLPKARTQINWRYLRTLSSWAIRNGFWVFGKWTPSIRTFQNAVIHEHLPENTALVSHSSCFPLYPLRRCPPTQKLPAFTTSQVTALSGFRLTPALPKCIQVRNQIPNNGMGLRSSAAAQDNETTRI